MIVLEPVDPEFLLVDWLTSELAVRAGTDIPADLEAEVPFVHVDHIGGADTLPTLAELVVDVEYFAKDKASTSALARSGHRSIRYGLLNSVLTKSGQAAVITSVRTETIPRPNDAYGNPRVVQYVSTYVIGFKPTPA